MSIQQPHLKLQALRDLLRDPSRWPEGFRFNYGDFETCAVGLAHRAGLIEHQGNKMIEAKHFGIDETTYWTLFVRTGMFTASHIADRINDWLAEHPEHEPAPS